MLNNNINCDNVGFIAENIKMHYLKNREIFNGLSFSVSIASILVICGENRFGKTSLIKAICGIEKIKSGQFICNNKRIDVAKQKDRNISAIFSDFLLNNNDTAINAITEPLRLRKINVNTVKERINHALELLDATDIVNKSVKHLSNIERFKVAIIRASIKLPDAIVIDDCFDSFNYDEVAQCCCLLKKMVVAFRFPTVILTSNQNIVKIFNEKTMFIQDGKSLQCAKPNELISDALSTSVLLFFGLPVSNFFDFTYTCSKGQNRLEFDDGFYIDNIVVDDNKIKIGGKYRAYLTNEELVFFKTTNAQDLSLQNTLIFSLGGERIK